MGVVFSIIMVLMIGVKQNTTGCAGLLRALGQRYIAFYEYAIYWYSAVYIFLSEVNLVACKYIQMVLDSAWGGQFSGFVSSRCVVWV